MGFGFKQSTPIKFSRALIPLLSVILLLGLFRGGSFLYQISGVKDLQTANAFIKQDSDKLLIAIGGVAKQPAHLGFIAKEYFLGDEKHITKESFETALQYIHDDVDSLPQKIKNSIPAVGFFSRLAGYSSDLVSLAGFDGEQHYIVVLQNTGEKRPNGGFFGSFALLSVKDGYVKQLEIIDSYLPNFDNPGTSITGPERLTQFLPDRLIYFIGANKVGFTYHDGGNIKALYEKSYPGKSIRGVIFLRSDMFSRLLDDFETQTREWQFVNAAIDLIRGTAKRGKKELYLESSQEYFETNATKLIKEFLIQFEEIKNDQLINVYLTDISGPLHGFLRREHLTTRFEQNTAYFWESNISFNKVDRFVDKSIECFNQTKKFISTKNEIVPLLNLSPGEYICSIEYTLSIPDRYLQYLDNLEEKYEITLTERENHILARDPERKTRGIIYFPSNVTIRYVDGILSETQIFKTPFANAATYQAWISGNGGTRKVLVGITVHEE